MIIPDEDLNVVALWPKSEGGQHVGVPIPEVMVTHIPSGLTAIVRQKSQHRARQVAVEMILGGLTSTQFRAE